MGMLQSIQAGAIRFGGCSVALELRMLKAEVMETLLYGCVTWTLGKEHFAELRTAHHRFLLRIIGFQRRQRTIYLMSYAKVLKKAQCESVETAIRTRHLLFAGGVQRTHNERLTMAGGENPGPGRPEKNWAQCLVDDLRVFRAIKGSTESVPLVFGVETMLWPTAAKKGGRWYRGVVEAAKCFMTRWHRDEAESSYRRHAKGDAKSDDKGRGVGEGQPYGYCCRRMQK